MAESFRARFKLPRISGVTAPMAGSPCLLRRAEEVADTMHGEDTEQGQATLQG